MAGVLKQLAGAYWALHQIAFTVRANMLHRISTGRTQLTFVWSLLEPEGQRHSTRSLALRATCWGPRLTEVFPYNLRENRVGQRLRRLSPVRSFRQESNTCVNFCSACGKPVTLKVPDGDNRPRAVCEGCGMIHYQNPKIVTGCLPVFEGRVLLCKRAIEPRAGLWTLPAGFMENDESAEEGAARETMEEACANVEIQKLYTVFSLPHISQVYMFFLASLPEPVFQAGEESLAVDLFEEQQIPWEQLAFPVITDTLQYYFADRSVETFPTRSNVINWGRRLGS